MRDSLKLKQGRWKCKNTAYLEAFLEKNYGDVDIDSPAEVLDIDERCKKLVFQTDGRKVIYQYSWQSEFEYHTAVSWYLFSNILNYKKAEFSHLIISFNNDISDCQKTIRFLEKYVLDMSKLLLLNSCPEVEIFILPDEIFRNLFGNNCVTGFFDPLKGKIYLDRVDAHATHEILHALANQWGICMNTFCHESLAECFKRPLGIPNHSICNIKQFYEIFFDRENLTNKSYGIGGLFFRFIFKHYGIKAIKTICVNSLNADCEQTNQIIKEATGENNIVPLFVEWFTKLDVRNEDWYFQRID